MKKDNLSLEHKIRMVMEAKKNSRQDTNDTADGDQDEDIDESIAANTPIKGKNVFKGKERPFNRGLTAGKGSKKNKVNNLSNAQNLSNQRDKANQFPLNNEEVEQLDELGIGTDKFGGRPGATYFQTVKVAPGQTGKAMAISGKRKTEKQMHSPTVTGKIKEESGYVPAEGDAAATSNSPTYSSREDGKLKKKIKEDSSSEREEIHNVSRDTKVDRTKNPVVDRVDGAMPTSKKSKLTKQAEIINKLAEDAKRLDTIKRTLGRKKETEVNFDPKLKKPEPEGLKEAGLIGSMLGMGVIPGALSAIKGGADAYAKGKNWREIATDAAERGAQGFAMGAGTIPGLISDTGETLARSTGYEDPAKQGEKTLFGKAANYVGGKPFGSADEIQPEYLKNLQKAGEEAKKSVDISDKYMQNAYNNDPLYKYALKYMTLTPASGIGALAGGIWGGLEGAAEGAAKEGLGTTQGWKNLASGATLGAEQGASAGYSYPYEIAQDIETGNKLRSRTSGGQSPTYRPPVSQGTQQ